MVREDYFSQTQILKKYKISLKQFKALLAEKKLPQINKEINLGEYGVTTCYILKADIEELGLEERQTIY